jgi:hypothetical protein
LLLPSTQTTCEKVFSKLKYIKTKLRSTLHQNNLTLTPLINVDGYRKKYSHLPNITKQLIETIANSSNELKKLLI